MAFTFTFSRRINAGQTYSPPQSATCQQGESHYEVEVIIPLADRKNPGMHLAFYGEASPDGGQTWFRLGGAEVKGSTTATDAQLLAMNPWTAGSLPPAGWRVRPVIDNRGTIPVTADYVVIIHDGDRAVDVFDRGRPG